MKIRVDKGHDVVWKEVEVGGQKDRQKDTEGTFRHSKRCDCFGFPNCCHRVASRCRRCAASLGLLFATLRLTYPENKEDLMGDLNSIKENLNQARKGVKENRSQNEHRIVAKPHLVAPLCSLHVVALADALRVRQCLA